MKKNIAFFLQTSVFGGKNRETYLMRFSKYRLRKKVPCHVNIAIKLNKIKNLPLKDAHFY